MVVDRTQANGIGVRICLFDSRFSCIEDARYVCMRVWITLKSRQQRRECPRRKGARQNMMHARQLGQGPRRCCRGRSSMLGGCQLCDQIKTKHLCRLIMQYSCCFSYPLYSCSGPAVVVTNQSTQCKGGPDNQTINKVSNGIYCLTRFALPYPPKLKGIAAASVLISG